MFESALSIAALVVFILALVTSLAESQGGKHTSWTPPVRSPRRERPSEWDPE